MLAGNRALGVGEPQLDRQAFRAPDAVGRPRPAGRRARPEQILRRLAVILHPLNGREAVMDFARCSRA